MAEKTKTELEEIIYKEMKNVQGDLSEEVRAMKEEMKEMKRPQIPQDKLLTERQAAEEFIEHFDSCDDGKCGIHNMKDDTKKQGFMKGFMLGKKLQGKKE